ncbi:MAG TPA: hypothetical protein VLG50_08420 [Candidatus Saccharimonadales bacterium]|nr:hypothetical protein [Candidatus Saccharimonadales bacterium]
MTSEYNLIAEQIKYTNPCLNNLDCSICLCPPMDPVLCPNDHLFCSACVITNNVHRNKCPQCNIETSNYKPAVRPIINILDHLEVYCLFKDNGCGLVMPRKNLLEHIQKCDYRMKKCKTFILKCDGNMMACDDIHHLYDDHNHCQYASKGCSFVGSKEEIRHHQCPIISILPLFNALNNMITTQYSDAITFGKLENYINSFKSDLI